MSFELNNEERDEVYSDLSLITTEEQLEDFLKTFRKKFKSFRYKISDAFHKSDSFFNDLIEK